MFGRNRLSKILVGLIVIGFLGVSVCIAIHQRDRAQAFLRDLTNLRLGDSTFTDAQRLAEEYKGKPWGISSQDTTCSAQHCNFKFSFDNRPLSYLPWVRRVALGAGISVTDGHVVGREVDYERDTHSYYEFVYIVQESTQHKDPHQYGVKKFKLDAQGTPHVIEVTLGPTSAPEDRKRAYALDLSCLARLHDCDTASAIFPPGW